MINQLLHKQVISREGGETSTYSVDTAGTHLVMKRA